VIINLLVDLLQAVIDRDTATPLPSKEVNT